MPIRFPLWRLRFDDDRDDLLYRAFRMAAWNPCAACLSACGHCNSAFISKQSKNDGMQLRTQAGELSSFVLDSLRGLPEILQYRQGEKRLEEMNRRTDRLMEQEAHLKSVAGKIPV